MIFYKTYFFLNLNFIRYIHEISTELLEEELGVSELGTEDSLELSLLEILDDSVLGPSLDKEDSEENTVKLYYFLI